MDLYKPIKNNSVARDLAITMLAIFGCLILLCLGITIGHSRNAPSDEWTIGCGATPKERANTKRVLNVSGNGAATTYVEPDGRITRTTLPCEATTL